MSVLQYFHLILGTACTISVRSSEVLTYYRVVFDNSYRIPIHYIVSHLHSKTSTVTAHIALYVW